MKSSKQKPAHGQQRAAAAVVAAVAPARPTYRWYYVLGIAAAFAALLTIYGPALNGPFLLDDQDLPYMLPQYSDAPLRAWVSGLRPLLMFSFWVNYVNSARDPYSYHFLNVVLHLVNGVWIYLSVRKLLEWAGTKNWTREVSAIFAAGLFLLHPLQTESVSYVASRSETLSVFFLLAAYVVFLYRPGPAISWGRAAAVLALFAGAVLSKEHTVILVPLLLLTDFYWNPAFSARGIAKNWKLYVPMAVGGIIGAAFVWRVLIRSNTAGFGMKDLPWYQYLFTQFRAVWAYVQLFVIPMGQNLDRDFPISRAITDHLAIVGLVALLALAAVAWIYRRRYPLASFGYFVFLLLLAPTSSFIPIRDPFAERRMYLPFIGLVLIVAEFVRRWKAARNVVVLSLAGILAVEAAITWQRNQLYADKIAIWKDAVEKSPRKVRPGFHLAYAYYDAGRCAEAEKEFARTASLGPPDYTLLLDWALACDCAGNSNTALEKLQQAAAMQQNAHVYSQIGMVYAKQGKYPEAMAALEKAIKINPYFDMSYFYRGNIYSLQGDNVKAAADYRQALAFNPYNDAARQALARVGR